MPDASSEPAAYKQALLKLAERDDPLEIMSHTVAAWRQLTQGLNAAMLNQQPEAGEWPIAQITGHLFDVDLVFGFRGRLMLTAGNPTYPGYDEKLWATMPRPPFEQLLDAGEGLRTANQLVFKSAPKQAWGRTANHSEQGPETFEELVRKMAGHDIAHLNQVQRAVEAVR
jgi:hypothetical protein